MTEAPVKKKWKWLRRLAIFGLACLILMSVILVAVQTSPAKAFIAARVNGALVTALPWPAELRGIGGVLPFAPTLEYFRLGTAADPWLELHDVEVTVDFAPLLNKRVSVERLAAGKVIVHRLPPASEEPVETEPLSLPVIADLPDWLNLGALSVDRLAIEEPVFGHAVAFSVNGAYLPGVEDAIALQVQGIGATDTAAHLVGNLRGGEVHLKLSAHDDSLVTGFTPLTGPVSLSISLDGPLSGAKLAVEMTQGNGQLLTVDSTLSYPSPLRIVGAMQVDLPEEIVSEELRAKLGSAVAFDVDLSLTNDYVVQIVDSAARTDYASLEIAGHYGLLDQDVDLLPTLRYDDFNRLVDGPPEGEAIPLTARVPLQGNLEALSLRPTIVLGVEDWISGQVDVGLGESITAKGELTIQPVGTYVPEEYRSLMADGGVVALDVGYAGSRLTINETTIRVGENTLVAHGTVDPGSSAMDLQVEGKGPDLKVFEALAGNPLAGAVQLSLVARGSGEGTTVTGTIGVEQLVAGTVQVPSGELALNITAGPFPDQVTDRMEAILKGSFPGMSLRPEVTRDLTLAGVVTLQSMEQLAVQDLNITDGNLNLSANGTIDLGTRAADFKGAIVVDEIGDYANIAELPYRGAADFKIDVASGDKPGEIVGHLSGALSQLSGLPNEVVGLTGTSVMLKADANYDGKLASLHDVVLEGAGLSTRAAGSYNTETRAVDLSLDGTLDDISALSPLAGRPLSGAATFTVKSSGPVDNLGAEGHLEGEGLILDVLRAESAEIDFRATGIPSDIAADLDATLLDGGESLVLTTKLAHKDTVLRINALELLAGENRIAASGVFDTVTRRGSGDLSADLPALADLKTWIELPLEGSMHVQANMAEGTQVLTGTLQSDGLQISSLKVGHAEGAFDVAQVFDGPSGTVRLNITELDGGDMQLASLSLTAEGPPSGLVLNIKAGGVYQEFTQFSVEGGGLLSGEDLSLALNDLNFGLEEYAFTLREETTLSWKDGEALLTPLVLESESGRLTVAGRYNAELVDARVEWSDLSLGLVELAGMDPMAGILTGSLTATGVPTAPTVVLDTTLAGFNPRPGVENKFPGLDGTLSARVSDGVLTMEVQTTVPERAEFAGDGAFPIQLSLVPWVLDVPEDGALDAHFKGTGDMSVFPPLFSLAGHEMEGALAADLSAAGTVSKPDLDGVVTVSDGYYENGSTSTILNDLAIRLDADGDTLKLTEFSANDGVGGTVTGDGQMVLDASIGSPYEFSLTLDKPRIVHRDDLRTQGEGKLHLKGDAGGAMLTGDLSVGPAYIAIPESSGKTQVTTVPYTEAGAPGEGTDEDEEPPYEFGLDVTLNFPGKVFVTGTGLDSEWDGTLKIKNHAADPSIEGVLRVKKGSLDFLGRIFSLAESTITFDGQTPPSPYLRIDAVNTTSEIEAHIRMEGTADNLNLSLESDPPLPQDEILSRVLFGQRLSDVSPVQALTLARYAPMFKKNVSGRSVLGSKGPKPFLVDRISLHSGTEVGEASITTGKYLGEDFYLEFEQGIGSAESLVSLDWLFAPQWALKGKTTSTGEGGMGVFWKKNY